MREKKMFLFFLEQIVFLFYILNKSLFLPVFMQDTTSDCKLGLLHTNSVRSAPGVVLVAVAADESLFSKLFLNLSQWVMVTRYPGLKLS
jgi:hypothetical protein